MVGNVESDKDKLRRRREHDTQTKMKPHLQSLKVGVPYYRAAVALI